MIPNIINYCWFGEKKKPKLAEKCICSWKKFCPDYEFIEWNENNFNVNMNAYTKWCYENKKFAFLSDYVRLWVIYNNGGIYFDTDVEVIKNIDFLLENEAFFGFEKSGEDVYINTGLGFGAHKESLVVKKMLEEYSELLGGDKGTIMCPELNTRAIKKMGFIMNGELQQIDNVVVYPKDYFNPYESYIDKLSVTPNTVSIHWYTGSCLSYRIRLQGKITKIFHKFFGVNCFDFIKKILK